MSKRYTLALCLIIVVAACAYSLGWSYNDRVKIIRYAAQMVPPEIGELVMENEVVVKKTVILPEKFFKDHQKQYIRSLYLPDHPGDGATRIAELYQRVVKRFNSNWPASKKAEDLALLATYVALNFAPYETVGDFKSKHVHGSFLISNAVPITAYQYEEIADVTAYINRKFSLIEKVLYAEAYNPYIYNMCVNVVANLWVNACRASGIELAVATREPMQPIAFEQEKKINSSPNWNVLMTKKGPIKIFSKNIFVTFKLAGASDVGYSYTNAGMYNNKGEKMAGLNLPYSVPELFVTRDNGQKILHTRIVNYFFVPVQGFFLRYQGTGGLETKKYTLSTAIEPNQMIIADIPIQDLDVTAGALVQVIVFKQGS